MRCENAAIILKNKIKIKTNKSQQLVCRRLHNGDHTMGEEGLRLFMRIKIYANWVSISRLAFQKEKRERQHQVTL